MDNLTAGNPLAHRVRVYYDGSSTIAEGMPVCYNYLTTQNWFGGSVSDEGVVTASETTAEGSHNKGKYLYVSNPICVNSTTGTYSQSAKTIDDDGDELDNLQVNMMVSVSSIDDSDINGNWKITAVNATDNTITLDMTAAEAAAVTDATADCMVKIDNIHAFAGVVAKGGWCGKTGPRAVDIYVPNGAIVPVKTVLTSTTAGRTILSVVSATQTLGNPTQDVPDFLTYSDGVGTSSEVDWDAGTIDSKPVAIAAETISSAGLVLAKLDDRLFIHQGGQHDHLFEVGAGAVDVTVNKMFLKFSNTAGHCQALHYQSLLTGTGGDGNKGIYRFETIVTGVPAANKHVYGLFSHLEIGASTQNGGHMSPLKLLIRTKNVNPNMAQCGQLAAIHIDWILRETTTGTLTYEPAKSSIIYVNTDNSGSLPEYFLCAETYGGIAMGLDDLVKDAICARTIKIFCNGFELYIPAYTLLELETAT